MTINERNETLKSVSIAKFVIELESRIESLESRLDLIEKYTKVLPKAVWDKILEQAYEEVLKTN